MTERCGHATSRSAAGVAFGQYGGVEGLAAILPTEAWNRLVGSGSPRTFRRGQPLLHQGDPARHVILLLRGRVKISRVDPDGSTVVLAVRGPGEILGEIGLLGGDVRSATVTAIDTCETRVVGADEFTALVRLLGLESQLLRHVIHRFREGEDLRAELSTLPARVRVARCLLRWAVVPGHAEVAGGGEDEQRSDSRHRRIGIGVGIGLSQEELAQAVGVHRSTVAQELRILREEGLISTRRHRIAITDLAGLRKRAEQ